MAGDEAPSSPVPYKTPEEKLLYLSRTGDYESVAELLNLWVEGKLAIDINCKGKRKSNNSWTPLHLACYFGHESIVELLIKHDADVNVINDTGDTPLHKAAYTGREELVLLLLSKNADVFIRNSENQTAREVTKNPDIMKLLKAAEDADIQRKNSMLLNAAREGDLQIIEDLLKSDNPPNINYVDSLGNSALHCASYRGRKEAAVLLLQNGIDTSIKNARGQFAIDMALNVTMKQILSVQPVKHFQKTASRFEGLLLRKSRFLGWKEVWTVLDKGVMSFFNSRADSTTGTKRKGYKYLDGARIDLDIADTAAFTVVYSDNTRQRFSVPYFTHQQLDRQKWENAIIEHIEFSSHYLKQGFSDSDPEDDEGGDIMPIGTMQDKLQTAQAHLQLLEKCIKSLKIKIKEVEVDTGQRTDSTSESWTLISNDIENMLECANKVSFSLSHCLTVFIQQEEVRLLQAKQQQERCRVLQDALHALAQEHHELEKSFVSPFHSSPNSPHYEDTDCDEFFDAFEGESPQDKSVIENSTSSSDTLVPSETDVFVSFSSNLSDIMKTPNLSKWGRPALPVPQFSRNDFSVWSILKQCIGKELSKITMPIVFNEPLSLLQRLAESVEYSYLLEKANNSDDPIERMEYVAAFAVAGISSNWERLGKPFNPLLGETYEFCREEEGLRLLGEQVSHHPPVSAFHADSPNYTYSGAIHPKLKLWARSVEIKPEGTLILKLKKYNETYTWTGVTCCVHNIIVGKLWMEQCGTTEITCHTNGLVAELNFKPAGWYSKDLNCVEGFIFDRQKTKLRFIHGKWCSFLKSSEVQCYDDYILLKDKSQGTTNAGRSKRSSPNFDSGDKKVCFNSLDDLPSTLLWEASPRPEHSSDYYNFTFFAMALNELPSVMVNTLPSTDSRLRPDIRKLEEGDVDGAAFEKNRLEEKQRETRKFRKKEKIIWEPVWFKCSTHPYAKEETWTYKGNYWDRNFSKCPDIF